MKLKRNAAFMSVFLTIYSTTVFAGFEWKGPGSSAPVSESAVVSMPMQKVTPVDQAPMSLTASTVKSSHVMSPAPVSAPVSGMPQLKTPGDNAVPAVSASLPSAHEENLSGFGNNLPLSVAMQQVVPEGYSVALGDDVNPDTLVSWKGGKPWKQVLAVMLAPQDLGYSLRGDVISISRFTNENHTDVSQAAAPVALTNEASPPASELAPVPLAAATPVATPTPAPAAPISWAAPAPAPVKAAAKQEAELPPLMEQSVPAISSPAPVAATPARNASGSIVAGKWTAENGRTLREVLTDWTRREGITLYWAIDYDYRITGRSSYNGSFPEAVGRLMDRFIDARPQPFGQLHLSSDGPKTLVVSSYDVPH